MLNPLDKKENFNTHVVDSNEGERTLLSSNKIDIRSPSLDLTENYISIEDDLIKYLADILIDGFLWQQKHASNSKQQKSSDLL